MNRKDFELAVRAAPEWTREALKTINTLEETIEAGMRYIQETRSVGLRNGKTDVRNKITADEIQRLYRDSECWDMDYSRVTQGELENTFRIFKVLFDQRAILNPNQPLYINDSFDCEDTAALFRTAARYANTKYTNQAVGMAFLYHKDGSHMAAIYIDECNRLRVIDPLMSYTKGSLYEIRFENGYAYYPDGTCYKLIHVYW